MTNSDRIGITLQESFRLLPADFRKQFTHLDQPYVLSKPRKGIRILKMAIYPKVASGFWRWRQCSYEIGIGSCGSNADLGAIGFYCFSKQENCGDGHFTNDVWKIVERVRGLRATEFRSSHAVSICLHRFYSSGRFGDFPCQLAGYDLAWLIEHSYPLFQQMLSGPVRETSVRRQNHDD